ncbi:MAG: fumarylacetoacetate hydrolase family protein [Actinomycetota bacterium]|nr:fumarylacetoacetate hydrolase family protein [Actinomycetota bacterium]
MTALVRYMAPGTDSVRVGVADEGRVAPLAGVASMAHLLAQPIAEIRALVDAADPDHGAELAEVRLPPPIDGTTPVWAAGVTYLISRDARIEESTQDDVYTLVYDAPRPELFFKAQAHHVVTDGDPVGRRSDSTNDTPEPELALVLNAFGETVAYTVANDMSSRSIEGENPLYLPQAKMFAGCCVLGPRLRLAWEVPEPRSLTIRMRILRGDAVVFDGTASTARLKRSFDELVEHLLRALDFPTGAVLSTGTCLVPALDAPVVDGDEITISIDGIDTITNTVTPTDRLMAR